MPHQDSNSTGITRAQGRRISNFPANTAIPGDSVLSFVSGGTNFQITLADFLAALNVTGAIAQVGSPISTPVLDKQGTVNNIRNLENGSGVKASVSPQNGIKLDHTFKSGSPPSGASIPILTDITKTNPIVRSAVAGNGMQIFANGDSVVFQATGGPSSTGTVIVNSLSDLPVPVGGVITLVTDVTYFPQSIVDISPNRLLIDTGNVALESNNRLSRGFTTTNTGALITVKNSFVVPIIKEMILLSPNGSVFDVQAGAGIVFNDIVNFDAAVASKVTAAANISFRNYSIVNFGFGQPKGIQFFGACQELNVSNGLYQDWDGILYDFGTATFANGFLFGPNIRFNAGASETVMAGSAATIASGALGQCSHNKFLGLANKLSGFNENTDGYEFIGNQGVDDTDVDSLSVNTAGTTVIIATIDTPVKIAGTWIDIESSQFTVDLSGRVTYNGLKTRSLPVDLALSADPASGTNKDFTVYVALNGSVITNSGVPARASSGDVLAMMVPWQIEFSTGDFIEMFLENNTDTTDFDVTRAQIRVK